MTRIGAIVGALTITLALSCGVLAPRASATAGFRLGFTDDASFIQGTSADSAVELGRAQASGATVGRFFLQWRAVGPSRPPSTRLAEDPGWSGYRWTDVDRAVRRMSAAGFVTVPSVFAAPDWAQAAGAPTVSSGKPVRPGTWRPSASAFRSFAVALARRYSGTYPDPLNAGEGLPAVRSWQVWDEPNLTTYIAPQWERTKTGLAPASPGIYRNLLNAFYDGVKSVSSKNYVITAGTSPYGELVDGGWRIPPARFWRAVF